MDWDRVHVARRSARSLLAVAVLATMFAVLWLIAAPGFSDPSFGPPPPPEQVLLSILVTAVGIGGVIFGFAWMWRLYKAPTKHEGAYWRFHDH
jgi:hypothetical protein